MIEVAHIKGIAEFDITTKISEINALTNLSLLCKLHHGEYDSKITGREKIRSVQEIIAE